MKAKKILWLLAFICLVDTIGFGIMIPLIYNYGKQFGMNKEMLGLLTASFSLAQFMATPLLGALSDRTGRKIILVICLLGTCLSFILFGLAGSLVMLFAARVLDGLTGGDISVAQAMVTDITPPATRAKYFGILGAALGLGYVIGPAAGGLLGGLGMRVPFFFAAGLSGVGALLSLLFLKETRKVRSKGRRFSYRALITVFKRPVVGPAVLTGFLLTTAQFVMLIGFQTYCSDHLKLPVTEIGLFYAGFGLSGIVMQLLVPRVLRMVPSRSAVLVGSTLVCAGAMALTGLSGSIGLFALGIGIYGLFNGLRNPMLNAIIADHSSEREEGEIMGINQSYTSIGQTAGPAAAGLAAMVSLQSTFFLSALLIATGVLTGLWLKRKV